MKKGVATLGHSFSYPLKASAVIRKGAIACLQGGYLIEGVEADDLTTIGRIEESIDNSTGANGDLHAPVMREKIGFKHDGSILPTHVGQEVYVVDAETLSADSNTSARSVAGKLFAIQDGLAIINFGA